MCALKAVGEDSIRHGKSTINESAKPNAPHVAKATAEVDREIIGLPFNPGQSMRFNAVVKLRIRFYHIL